MSARVPRHSAGTVCKKPSCHNHTAFSLASLPQTGTDYGPFIANEPSPIHTTTLVDCCTRKLVADWQYMRQNVSRAAAFQLGQQSRVWLAWVPPGLAVSARPAFRT
jgi:hypothetical protein